MPSFFFRELQLITVLLLIWDSYVSWSTRFVSLKLYVGFSISKSVSFLLKLIFVFNNMHGFFHIIRDNCFQNGNNRKSTHSFAPKSLIFKLQLQVLKFNDICVSWSFPKLTWWQILLNNLFIYFLDLFISRIKLKNYIH